MKAKANISRVFHHLAPVNDPLLLTGVVVLPDNTTKALTITQVTAIPDVVRVVVPALVSEQYELRILYNGVARWSEHLEVGPDLLSDFPLGETASLKLDATAPGSGETVTAKLITPAGVVGVSTATTFTAATFAFEFSNAFALTDSGHWSVVWFWQKDGDPGALPYHVTNLVLAAPSGKERIAFEVADTAGNGGTAHSNATVVIQDILLKQVAQGVTNGSGGLSLDLYPGVYRASIFKTGKVFSLNNFTFTVTAADTGKATVHLISEAVTVTATPAAVVAPLCKLFADIYLMDGSPLHNATVKVALQHRPQSFSGTVVFDTATSYLTDSNGHVEFSLVQGIQVEVSVAPLSLRRIITVPSGDDAANPVNLMTLLSAAEDLFDIIIPNVTVASKRAM